MKFHYWTLCATLLGMPLAWGARPTTGTLDVYQISNTNTPQGLSVQLSGATSPGAELLHEQMNTADYWLRVPGTGTDGVMIACVAEDGRNHVFYGGPSDTQYLVADAGPSGSSFYISAVEMDGGERNIDVAFGYFPITGDSPWLAGFFSANGEGQALYKYAATAGIELGSEFIDHGDGTMTLDLRGLGASSQEGVLLVNGFANRSQFGQFQPHDDGTFTLFSHDHGTNADTYVRDGMSFVYVPVDRVGEDGLVAMGRVRGDATNMLAGGNYSVTKLSSSVGTYRLNIPGYGPEDGTLLISAPGGQSYNLDNIVAYTPSTNSWIITTRDLPNVSLQDMAADNVLFDFAFFTGTDETDIAGKRIYVDQNATGGNSGTSWADAYTSLDAALTAAMEGDEIWVAQGTYTPGNGYGRNATFYIDEPVSLYGGFEPGMTHVRERRVGSEASRTVLNGEIGGSSLSDNVHRVISAHELGGALLLDGFVIRGGYLRQAGESGFSFLEGGGAGLGVEGSSAVTVANCTFENNTAIGLTDSSDNPSQATFLDAYNAEGGAIYCGFDASLSLENCRFIGNTAQGGAGVNGHSRFPYRDGSHGGDGLGGAVYADVQLLDRCFFEENRAIGGAGGNGWSGTNGTNSNPNGFHGTDGGNGGSGRGGAVYHFGQADINESAFNGNFAISGAGGTGGKGGNGDWGSDGPDGDDDGNAGGDSGGPGGSGGHGGNGGNGGNSGQAVGGAIYFSVNNAVFDFFDCAFVGNVAVASAGGDAGDGGNPGKGGDGGDGDDIGFGTAGNGGDGGDNGDGGDGGDGGRAGYGYGGAIYAASNSTQLSIHNCAFVMNEVDYLGPGDGGSGKNYTTVGFGIGGRAGRATIVGNDGTPGSNGDLGNGGVNGEDGPAGAFDAAVIYAAAYSSNANLAVYNTFFFDNLLRSPGGNSPVEAHVLFNNLAVLPNAAVGNYADELADSGLSDGFTDLSSLSFMMDAPERGGDGSWHKGIADNKYGDLRHRSTSFLLDLGDNGVASQGILDTDLAGAPRFQDGAIAVGPYESYMVSLSGAYPFAADSNGNQVSNLMEYMSGYFVFVDNGLAPIGELTKEGSLFYFNFQHRINAQDAESWLEVSYDLDEWFELSEEDYTMLSSSTTSGIETATIRFNPGTEHVFIRRIARAVE